MAKTEGGLTLTLGRTKDILADLGRLPSRATGHPVLVGFAAETHDVVAHARAKLQRKAVDLMVANDVSRADAGFEVDANAVTIVSADGAEDVPLQSKAAVAARILDRVESLLASAASPRVEGMTMSREIADHLRYYKEMGVIGHEPRCRLARAGERARGGKSDRVYFPAELATEDQTRS